MKQITLLLADDHKIVREGLRMLLEAEPDFVVVGEAQTGFQAVDLASKLRPAVVLMDIQMPQLNGLEATRQILKANPSTKILMLSAHNDDAIVEEVAAAGAKGYLLKQAPAEVLSKAIRDVNKGSVYFSPTIWKRLKKRDQTLMGRLGTIKSGRLVLSSRETQVLHLIAQGFANREMAESLGISIKTIEKHRQHLMEKLGIHDTAGLTRYAVRARVIENETGSTDEASPVTPHDDLEENSVPPDPPPSSPRKGSRILTRSGIPPFID